MRMRMALGLLPALLAGCLVQGEAVDLTERDVSLTVFHTGDWHSRLVPYTYDPPAPIEQLGLRPENAPFGGVARLATLLKRERASAGRNVWLDTGDCFQGAPIFNIFGGEAEIRAQSELGLDAAVIGNHEFDLGVTNYVDQFEQWGRYAALAANYDTEDPNIPGNKRLGDVAQPYVILNREGLKILVIGHGNFSSLNSIGEGGNSIGVTPYEHNRITQMYIDQLANEVDVIGVITHLGMEYDIGLVEGYKQYIPTRENPPTDQECTLLENDDVWECEVPPVRGIDFILGGHFHLVLNPPRVPVDIEGRTVPVIHSGAFMQFLGRADMVFRHASRVGRDDWYGFELVDHRYSLFTVDATLDEDVETMRLMDPYLWSLGMDYDLLRPIGFSPSGVTRTASNGGDSAMGNIVANSIRTRNLVESDFSLTNSAGIRDNLPPGPITAEMLFNVFPFENTITTFFLSGQEVREVFDFVASRSRGRGCRTQVQVSGVEFTIRCDCDQNQTGCCAEARGFGEFPPACADDILIDGQPLNPNGTYEVGANDYMARGGSGFQMLRRNTTQKDSGISLRTAVEEYLQQSPPCTPDDVASLGQCTEQQPGSIACQYEELIAKYGELPCITNDGLVDGRVKRVLPK
jgi:2',3'-cyclic-nucleotide 2'-phosphodiesterase (5'-nucleotidase family)